MTATSAPPSVPDVATTAGPRPVLAVPPGARPEIVCPSWCTVPFEEHFADLGNWEGFVIHWSERDHVRLSAETYPDGTPDLTNPPQIHLDHGDDQLGIDDAELLARAILAAVAEARS